MKVRYETINGEVMSETRGGVHKQYIPDPLGSTVALMDDTQTITDTFSYWPYGEVASRTGTTATPFQFNGTFGYYYDSATRSYVRARYLDTPLGRWQTIDPIRSGRNWYGYVGNNPSTLSDPAGLQAPGGPNIGGGCSPENAIKLHNQFDFICGRSAKIDQCEANCCNIGDTCFGDTCTSPNTTIRCYNPANPFDRIACAKKGSDVCASIVGRDIVICPAYWTDPGCSLCKLAHEFVHHCGQLGHSNTLCFSCISAAIPSCAGKV